MLKKTGNILILLFVLSGTAVEVYGSDIRISATVSSHQVYLYDRLYYELTVSGARRSLPDPRISFPEGFRLLGAPQTSSQITFTNGRWSSRKTFTYLLRAQKTGEWTIPPASINIGNKIIKSNSLLVKVNKLKAEVSTGTTESKDALSIPSEWMDDIFLWATVDKTHPYVGEALTVSYHVFTRVRISGMKIQESPVYSGFWSEEVSLPQTPVTRTKIVNGIKYTTALVHKVILFPTVSGELTIDPLTMSFNVSLRGSDPFDSFFNDPFGSSFFSRVETVVRSSQSLTIDVKPLPSEGRPDDFSGAVGTFNISARADKTEVHVGEAITVTLDISGPYGLETLSAPPMPALPSFKSYEPKPKQMVNLPDKNGWKTKSFEYILVPYQAGNHTVPPIHFSFFDPRSTSYKTVSTSSIPIQVSPSAFPEHSYSPEEKSPGHIQLLHEDIRYIKTNVRIQNTERPYRSLWFLLILTSPIAYIPMMLWIASHFRKMRGDAAYARSFKARSLSQKLFQKARDALKNDQIEVALDHTAAAFVTYIGNRLNLPPGGLTLNDTLKAFRKMNISEELSRRLETYWTQLDQARYAPGIPSSKDIENFIQTGRSIIDELEHIKLKKKRKRKKTICIGLFFFIAIFTLFGRAAAGGSESFQALFEKANTHFAAGDFATAQTLYLSIEKQGCCNDKLFYNIGTCFLKRGDVGRAILYLRRAERIAPRDEDIQANLSLARRMVVKGISPDASDSIISMLLNIHQKMTPTEATVIFSFFYLATIGLFLWSSFPLRRRIRKRLLRFALFSLILMMGSGTLLGLKIYQNEFQKHAVAIESDITARSGPGSHFTQLFSVQSGYEMIITRVAPAWCEIRLPNGYKGWVPRSSIELI